MFKGKSHNKNLNKATVSVYSDPDFKKAQQKFENKLGLYALNNPLAQKAVDEGIYKMKNTLYKYYLNDKPQANENYIVKFQKSPPPCSINELNDKINAFKRAAGVDTCSNPFYNNFSFKSILQQIVSGDEDTASKIVDKLGVNSAYLMGIRENSNKQNFLEKMFHLKTKKANVFSNDFILANSEYKNNYFWSNFFRKKRFAKYYQRQLLPQIPQNLNEKRLVKYRQAQSFPQNINSNVPYNRNDNYYTDFETLNTKGFMGLLNGSHALINKKGFRMISGVSGKTANLLNVFKCLGINDKNTLLAFRLALIGHFITKGESSLYEILEGSHLAGVKGKENLTDVISMDSSEISPLNKDEILEKCGVELKGQNKGKKALPFDEYLCNKFVFFNNNDFNNDDNKFSLFADFDRYIFKNSDNPEKKNLSYLEKIATTFYSTNGNLFMNRKLLLDSYAPFIFKLNLKSFTKKYIFTSLMSYYTSDDYLFDLIEKVKIKHNDNNAEHPKKDNEAREYLIDCIQNKLENKTKNSNTRDRDFEALTRKVVAKKYFADYKNKFSNHLEKFVSEFEIDYDNDTDNIIKFSLANKLAKKIESFCNKVARELTNKYVNKSLLSDIDIMNFGMNEYFKDTQKYKGYVFSGQFVHKGILNEYKQGHIYTTKSQMSTSKNLSVASHFVKDGTATTKPCLLIIKLNGFKAVDFSKVSSLPDESEVLIPPETKFRVEYVSDTGPRDKKYKFFDSKRPDLNPTYIYLTEINS